MEAVTTAAGLRRIFAEWRQAGLRTALVPTMGALHEGHLALVDQAKQLAGRVVATIFVNPLQFGPEEDLTRYPRDLERDQGLLGGRGVDVVYAPAVAEMYPAPPLVTIDPGPMAGVLEGAVRPGHFAGVLTVLAKLFHLVGPDVACFGQKDIQQAVLVRRMVADLDWPIEVVVVPTVRDADGLALSSRNRLLSPPERQQALVLSRMLRTVESAWLAGVRGGTALLEVGREVLARVPAVRIDYAVIVDPAQLDALDAVVPGSIAAVAARVGTTRLIDNVTLAERGS